MRLLLPSSSQLYWNERCFVLYINLSQVAKCQKLDDISIISMLSVKSKVFCIILIQSVQKQFVQLEKSPPVKIRIQNLWTHSRSCLKKKYIFIILILSLNCSEQYFYAGANKDYTVLRLVEKFTWYSGIYTEIKRCNITISTMWLSGVANLGSNQNRTWSLFFFFSFFYTIITGSFGKGSCR